MGRAWGGKPMKMAPRKTRFQNTDRPCFGQNTGCVLNIRVLCFGIPSLRSMTCVKTQNTNRNLSKTNLCFGIPPLISIGCLKTQNTDFLTLRGRCSPAGGGETPPTPGRSLGADQSQTKHPSDDGGRYRQASTAVVIHPSSQSQKETTHG